MSPTTPTLRAAPADEPTTSRKKAKPTRRYDSAKRLQQAAETRQAILDVAMRLFAAQGYAKTTVGQIAKESGVAVDTLYASIGRKPEILRQLIEIAVSGTPDGMPARERGHMVRIRERSDAREQLAIYAQAITAMQPGIVWIFLALREAGSSDAECLEVWKALDERRALAMRELAKTIRATGQLRDDLTDDEVADVIWTMNSPEYWDLLVLQRKWTPERFSEWLRDAWIRLLLA